jgi:hypothetical protein
MTAAPYAVLFKTHFWDGYVQRQFDRLRARVRHGDLYVVVDETHGPVTGIGYDRVVAFTEARLLALGLADRTESGGLLWYNIDYIHAYFLHLYPHYAHYVTVEYDAVINRDVDTLVARVAQDGIDFLGFPGRQPVAQNIWFRPHAALYGAEAVRHYLNCIAVFSHRALALLLARRQEMSRALAAGALGFWPYAELFIPTELARAGHRLGSLSDYGSTEHYEWWPPLDESELPGLGAAAFVHPVLEGQRYIASTLRHMPTRDLVGYFHPSSMVQRRLARYPAPLYMPALRREVRRRARESVPRVLRKVGLMRRWG